MDVEISLFLIMNLDNTLTFILQDKKCTNNVTFRCFGATIVASEKQRVLHILSVCL